MVGVKVKLSQEDETSRISRRPAAFIPRCLCLWLSPPQVHSVTRRFNSMKNPNCAQSVIEPATFRLVAQFLNQLCYDVPPPLFFRYYCDNLTNSGTVIRNIYLLLSKFPPHPYGHRYSLGVTTHVPLLGTFRSTFVVAHSEPMSLQHSRLFELI
jgi:hypothetical protein